MLAGGGEGDEFVGDDPVEVPVLHLLVVLVLGDIECLIVEPSELHCVLESLKAILNLKLLQYLRCTYTCIRRNWRL